MREWFPTIHGHNPDGSGMTDRLESLMRALRVLAKEPNAGNRVSDIFAMIPALASSSCVNSRSFFQRRSLRDRRST
jgi:hypothetical protein